MIQSVSPFVKTILAGRGLSEPEMQEFLYPDYSTGLHDPFLLTDMEPAVTRIILAAERGEVVVVYGDYDIDGITASAVMIEGLAALGITATSYIPDRFEEGYGINQNALEAILEGGAQLVISVDCGVTSATEAAWAQAHGLDLIITDHHAVPEVLPEAIAVINPKRLDDAYPFKELAGVGVAFKVIQALQMRIGKPATGQEKWLLDLVALGTVCDVMDLVGENRVLVSYGLKVMRSTRRSGLKSLAAIGGVDITKIKAEHLGFVLGPRMNAAGRLEHAARSVELVMTNDAMRAHSIALELDSLNLERRSTQAAVFAQADAMAAHYADDPVLVLAASGWNHGIVGIVASKLVEKWHKPTLVMEIMGDTTKGSARSAGAFNMVDGLRASSAHLTKFGGHFYAAGYTLPTSNVDALRASLNETFRSGGFLQAKRPVSQAEVELDHLGQASWELINELDLLEPHGAGNPQPLLGLHDLSVVRVDKIGADKKHYRLTLRDVSGATAEAVGFGLVDRVPGVRQGQTAHICMRLGRNEWQGRVRLQLGLVELVCE